MSYVHPDFVALARTWGIHTDATCYIKDEWKQNCLLALDEMPDLSLGRFTDGAFDAQPGLVTTPNSGIPSFLTMIVDPNIIKILLAPNKAATIFGEVKKGTWVDQTAMFPVVERTGEVSSYGDFNENGHTGLNTDFPQRQAYLYQTTLEYGELEMERAGLARIAWAAALDESAVVNLNKFQNLTYFFGVQGLQNYGLLNDPELSAPITPAAKNYGGTKWVNNGVIVAQATKFISTLSPCSFSW